MFILFQRHLDKFNLKEWITDKGYINIFGPLKHVTNKVSSDNIQILFIVFDI